MLDLGHIIKFFVTYTSRGLPAMDVLKQTLDNMFNTRKLKSWTHHEGSQGVISIRFDGLLRSHIDLQSDINDPNSPTDNHVTFKKKTKSEMNRDLDRSKGLIKRHNTRSKLNPLEKPRNSEPIGNILYSNLSPEATSFQPMFTSETDDIIPCPSPVAEFLTHGACMNENRSSVQPECSDMPATIDVPVMPDAPTDKHSDNAEHKLTLSIATHSDVPTDVPSYMLISFRDH